jgi:hypothetical protein
VPSEPDRPRPGDRSGAGPTGDDIVEDPQGGGAARGVIRPPENLDPGIHRGTVPEPNPRTTPVIPPPGTPGGDPNVIPR